MQQTQEKIAMRVSVHTILANLLLSVGKLAAGIVAHSGAMVSDAVHSASDVFSTLIVMVGVKAAGRDSDHNHRYGHERMECVASILLAVILAATGIAIGINGIESLRGERVLVMPGLFAMVMAIISIVAKELMFHYTRRAAVKVDSGALMADAWHHRSDALSSIGSFVGILGARCGFLWMDALASVLICVFIVKAAADIFIDAVKKMTDESCSDDMVRAMWDVIMQQEGVIGVDDLKTRLFGSKVYVDIEISANASLTLVEGHAIAEAVHRAIEQAFPAVKHCMVHVNPFLLPNEEE